MKNFLWYSLMVNLLVQVPLIRAEEPEAVAQGEPAASQNTSPQAEGVQGNAADQKQVEQVASKPEAPQEGAMQPDEKLEILGGGPDTSELSEEDIGYQGNWVKKNEWVREAEEISIQIHELFKGISDQRGTFYDAKFKEVENALDDFYIKTKFERGTVQELVESLEKEIEGKRELLMTALKAKDPNAALDDLKQLEIKEQIAALKASLEQVKVDIQAIDDIDRGFEVRFKTIDDIMSKTMGSMFQADTYLQQTYHILDDKKVRERFYKIKEIFEQVKAVDAYFKNDLATDFTKLITTLHEQIKKAEDSIKELEDKGIPIKKQVEELEVTPEKTEVVETKEKEILPEAKIIPEKKVIKEEPSIPSLLYEKCIAVMEWIATGVQSLFERMFGTKVQKLKVRKAEV